MAVFAHNNKKEKKNTIQSMLLRERGQFFQQFLEPKVKFNFHQAQEKKQLILLVVVSFQNQNFGLYHH